MAENISKDFSNTKIMLYFYFNSSEISDYLNKSFVYFGDYSFKEYKLENSINKDFKENKNIDIASNNINKKELEKLREIGEFNWNISKLIERIKSTDYFFFTSPFHFKISVKHQNIPFIVILKFNGYIWKVNKIIIPYDNLVNLNNISLKNN